MTAVVLIGDFPSTGILQATEAQRFDMREGDETAAAFIDHMAYALRQRRAVLVVYPSWQAERARKLVRLARASLLTDRIAGMPLDAPPLALSLIADQLMFASSYTRPGVLACLAQRLCESVQAGAWVNSVARLEHIKTGLGAHVSSFLPGNGFSVVAGPRASVHRISSAKPVQPFESRPADPVLMLFSNENGDVEWLQRSLRPSIAVASVTAVPVQPLSTEFWGTKKYAEYVAFSGHPHALHALLGDSSYRPCPWCGEPTVLPECLFCLMVQPVPEGPSASPSPQGSGQTHQGQARPAQSAQAQVPHGRLAQASPAQPHTPQSSPAEHPVQPPHGRPASWQQPSPAPQAPPPHAQTPPYPDQSQQASPSPHNPYPHGGEARHVPSKPAQPAEPRQKKPLPATPVVVPAEARTHASPQRHGGASEERQPQVRSGNSASALAPPVSWGDAAVSDTVHSGGAVAPKGTAEAPTPSENMSPAQPPINEAERPVAPEHLVHEQAHHTESDDDRQYRTDTVVFPLRRRQ